MSLTRDVAIVGAIGIGAYFILRNADKIGAWLGSQLVAPAQEAVGEAIEGVYKPIYDAGAAAGAATGERVREEPLSFALNPLWLNPVGEWLGDILQTLLTPKTDNIGNPALITNPIVPQGSGVIAAPDITTPTSAELQAALMAHYLQPIVHGQAGPVPYNSTQAISAANAAIVYSGSAPAGATLEAAQKYAQTFAMPGSEAWIAAGL